MCLGILLFTTSPLLAQTTSPDSESNNSHGEIFRPIETLATFPGGMKKFYAYIAQNMKYPKVSRKAGVEGKIAVEFYIQPDGAVDPYRIRVVPADEANRIAPPSRDGRKFIFSDLDEACNNEAIRVIKNSPRWIPAKNKKTGENTEQKMIVPIVFKK